MGQGAGILVLHTLILYVKLELAFLCYFCSYRLEGPSKVPSPADSPQDSIGVEC